MTENGVTYESFRETCDAMGLLEDGALVRQTMQEVSKSTVSSKAIRFTFAVLHSEFVVSERLGTELWEEHKNRMCAQPRKEREEVRSYGRWNRGREREEVSRGERGEGQVRNSSVRVLYVRGHVQIIVPFRLLFNAGGGRKQGGGGCVGVRKTRNT